MTPASHREQLNGMLCEAAEIEHTLMCSYLYAAFSLKQSQEEGLTEAEVAAVRRWRGEIVAVAIDEMLHLALVNNLIAAIGERPHYRRFNFPIMPGLFPADVAVSLAPLDVETLDHFIYLERPHTAQEIDTARYEKGAYRRVAPAGRLMVFPDDYVTVGELYAGILTSFRNLIAAQGAAAVMVGGPETQLTRREFALDGLQPISTLADVEQAIHRIVSQGEGSSDGGAASHFSRFCEIRREWQALVNARPDFVPARPVAYDPVMRTPVVTAKRVHIVEEPAATLLDAGNTCYALMLRLLGVLNDPWLAHSSIRPEVAEQSLALMHAISTIGTALTRLPANPTLPGVNAGLTFTVSRSALSFVSPANACSVLAERMQSLSERLSELASLLPALASSAKLTAQYANRWAHWRTLHDAPMQGQPARTLAVAVQAAPAAAPDASERTVVGRRESVRGTVATVHFDHGRCIHARHCVLGEPQVFLANTPGDWIYPDAADPARLVRIALACPSGAIVTEGRNGEPLEQPPAVNQLRVRENGPLAVHAELYLAGTADGFRATLCRCGLSANKPYCDGSHATAGFVATGEPDTRPSDALAVRNGPLHVQPTLNGPLELRGNLELLSGTGRTVERLERVRLCRCGHSQNKPYCDNSHLSIGFEAAGSA